MFQVLEFPISVVTECHTFTTVETRNSVTSTVGGRTFYIDLRILCPYIVVTTSGSERFPSS